MEQPTIIKNYATYVGGLFTEATPLNYPENTVQFTQNFRYDPSGYIERRLGLEEAGNIQRETTNCDLVDTYRWESVANRNDIEFIVIRNGDEVSIYEEVSPTEDEYTHKFTIDLHDHLVESTTDLNLSPISMVSGRGELFITGKHINPFRVEYTPTDSATTCTDAAAPGFKVVPYDVLTRDFEGIDDGVDNQENPTTLSDSHLYNLLNRGWTRTRIYEYFTEVGEYPSKSEYYILGFFTDTDGKEKWSVEELRKTNTGSSNAPTGHIIQNVFNTCIDDDYVSTETIPITRYNVNNDNTVTIITDVPHTASDGDTVELVGGNSILHTWCTYDFATDTTETFTETLELDGVYTADVETSISYRIPLIVTMQGSSGGCIETFEPTFGKMKITNGLPANIPCCVEKFRPEVNNFYAGRLWHMSVDSDRIGSNVYFSQVAINDEDTQQAYQDQDPTSRDYNELLKTDGGVINIPEMGNVLAAKNLRDSQLLFADNGIWSISGSYNSYFDATNYSVSKLTDVGCISAKSVQSVEDTYVYASARGIYIISNENRVKSITENNIHTRYRDIPVVCKKQIEIEYHPYDKTIHVLHSWDVECPNRYCDELILNHRLGSWYEYKYTGKTIASAFHTGNDEIRGKGLAYLVQDGDQIKSHYLTNCSYTDFNESIATAYLHTSPETVGDLLHEKKLKDIAFYFDNIEDSEVFINLVWGWRLVSNSCNTSGTKYVLDNPCHAVAINKDLTSSEEEIALSIEYSSVDTKPLKIFGWVARLEPIHPDENRKRTRRPRKRIGGER